MQEVGAGRDVGGVPAVVDVLHADWTVVVTGVTETLVAGEGVMGQTQATGAAVLVLVTAANPAKIFGLYPQKGALQPGADADIVVWDANKKVQHGVRNSWHRTDYNLFEGWEKG